MSMDEKTARLAQMYGYGPGAFRALARLRKQKPLSPARAAEFRGRRLKRLFGDRKSRAERFDRLCRYYDYDTAVGLSRMTVMEVSAVIYHELTETAA
jgi:hypothetical protein